jgi:hypothetical protein
MNGSKYLQVLEIILCLVLLVLAGPWVLMGLGEGIHLFHEASAMPVPEIARQAALVFLLYPVGGVVGLISIWLLILCEGTLRRHRFAALLITSGLIAGTCAAATFLVEIGTMEIKHPDHGGVDWRPITVFSLVLVPPMIVAWRRVVLVWSS